MKRLMNMRVFVAVLAAVCMIVLLMTVPTRSVTPGQYDPWLDVNNDGKIDGKDIALPALIFGTAGQSISKASINYDSGWINITDKCGQNITLTLGLNVSDWNKESLGADIIGKTTPTGDLRRNLGLTRQVSGWNQTYGGTNNDEASALVQTSDGGYALAGWTSSFGAGSADFWLVKTDAFGNTQWNKTYGGTGSDEASALVQTADGGYALAGETDSFGVVPHAWLVKTDSWGNMIWNQTYGGALGDDYACALVQTADGGYALAGETTSFGALDGDFWLVKTDSSGNALWNKTYGGTIYEEARSLVQTADGGYAIAGFTNSFGAGGFDFWLVKTDAIGNIQWNKTYGGTRDDWAKALVRTDDGGYAILGETDSFRAGGKDFWLVKTDASGDMQWNETYGGTNVQQAYALVRTADGGYAMAGTTWSFGAGSADFWLVKTDSSGNALWNKTYGGADDERAYALVRTTDGGFALAGASVSFGVGNNDFWLVETDASGNFGVESGLAWVDSPSNTITLYRGATDIYWNYVRMRLWQPKTP